MKNYHVVLTSLVNPFRDLYQNDVENFETKNYYFDIDADSEEAALKVAKDQHTLLVWESDVYEN